jgi:hypothetical protein
MKHVDMRKLAPAAQEERRRPDQRQLKQATISHMRRLTKSPARVRSYFRQKSMRCAA